MFSDGEELAYQGITTVTTARIVAIAQLKICPRTFDQRRKKQKEIGRGRTWIGVRSSWKESRGESEACEGQRVSIGTLPMVERFSSPATVEGELVSFLNEEEVNGCRL